MRSKPTGPAMRAEIVDAERLLCWRSEAGDWVWTFALDAQGASTRLLSRNRIALHGSSAGQLVLEPGSLVMERKMLLGVRERAERLHRAAPP